MLPKALKKQYICRIPEALKLSLAAARINRLAWMKCYATWPRVYNSFMLEPAHKLKWPQSFNWLNSWHLCKMKNSGMAESFFPKQKPVLESLDTKLGSSTDTLWMNYVTWAKHCSVCTGNKFCQKQCIVISRKPLSWWCVSTLADGLYNLQKSLTAFKLKLSNLRFNPSLKTKGWD